MPLPVNRSFSYRDDLYLRQFVPMTNPINHTSAYLSLVAGKTVWSPCYTRAISECFRDKELIIKRHINSPSLLLLYFNALFSSRLFTEAPLHLIRPWIGVWLPVAHSVKVCFTDLCAFACESWGSRSVRTPFRNPETGTGTAVLQCALGCGWSACTWPWTVVRAEHSPASDRCGPSVRDHPHAQRPGVQRLPGRR